MKIGIVSGYFNPVHKGHLEYIHAAKAQCEFLICIVNNDNQVKLKGSKPFMDEEHRAFIMSQFRDIDIPFIAVDTDKTVCKSLRTIWNEYKNCSFFGPEYELFFFNSGDRVTAETSEAAEVEVCKELGIKYVAIPLPKRYSSSELKAQL